MVDLSHVQHRVRRALQAAGSDPWLVGYDANGIQELVTSSSRPIAMFGASTTIARFDQGARRDTTIFAGGGRGVELAPSEQAAMARAEELTADFRRKTWGGVMASACVPYDAGSPGQSLRWLRRKLEIQKDQAAPPGGMLPSTKGEQCADCTTYLARLPSRRPDAQGEMVCDRCHAMADAGRENSRINEERVQSLLALSPGTQRVAAVSIDGNDLGDFFDSLESLEQLAAASDAIGNLFREAHGEALDGIARDKISLATGGDDVRLFLAWEDLIHYAGSFVAAVERRADLLASQGAPFTRLAGLGVGIGAVVADAHLPASRLMAYAHELERSAKRLCRPSGQKTTTGSGVRSAFDFAVLTAGDAPSGSLTHDPRIDGRPIPMDARSWTSLLASTRALASIPPAQRAILDEARALVDEEFQNLFRYQVARSQKWHRWYESCGVDWRDAEAVVRHRPRPVHLDLVRLLSRHTPS
ncbi:hypothetical protein WME94_02525 [Sorangium sp. So ce429]